uniref:Endonuclease domain-containing 1 protein-like n=1 Tax=Pelusios castaneus TaxID=367368 RepID=A0A8C8RYN3_9SAUR
MDWRVLLGCVSLWAGLAVAEVGTFDLCRAYFYRQTEPHGFDRTSDDSAQICQKYTGTYHFATLYDKSNRIPLWSAYKLIKPDKGTQEPRRPNDWFVEPQSGDGRMATMTLTNAAPMEPCFNQIRWKKLEINLKNQLTEHCINKKGTPYLVTGTVPSGSEKIPRKDEETAQTQDQSEYNRVSVPSHVWTAVCCDHTDNNIKFSITFLAENQAESNVKIIDVEQLNSELSQLYHNSPSIKIFEDDCNSKSPTEEKIASNMKLVLYHSFQVLLSDRYSQLLPPRKRNRLDLETHLVLGSTSFDQNKMQLTNIRFLMTFPSLADWSSYFQETYRKDNLVCVLAPSAGADPGGEAEASGTTDHVCVLQQPRSGLSATGRKCIGDCGYRSRTAYSWCQTISEKLWDYCCTDKCRVPHGSNQYECSRGDGTSIACSPQYSTVTISGKACRVDHPCGLYGESYFWCYTDYLNDWDYCCSPRHYCGNHGANYQWCYTADPQGHWKHCTAHVPTQEAGGRTPAIVHHDSRDLRY